MKHIFVDTNAWDALADKKDKDHTNAIRFRDKIVGKYKLYQPMHLSSAPVLLSNNWSQRTYAYSLFKL
jgi:predicted nucleic acid-binding protein